ncbi:MAG: hypothetical protein ACFFHD_06615 [Promethearchaeota archaeon]
MKNKSLKVLVLISFVSICCIPLSTVAPIDPGDGGGICGIAHNYTINIGYHVSGSLINTWTSDGLDLVVFGYFDIPYYWKFTYELKITFDDFDSGIYDTLKVKLDWDNPYVLIKVYYTGGWPSKETFFGVNGLNTFDLINPFSTIEKVVFYYEEDPCHDYPESSLTIDLLKFYF